MTTPKEFADNLTAEFKQFQTAITNEYLSRKGVDSSFSSFSLQSLHLNVAQIGRNFRARTEDLSAGYLAELDYGNLVSQHVLSQLFSFRVNTIVSENTEQVLRLASNSNGRFADLFSRSLGNSMGLLLQNKLSKIEFVSRDAARRRWKSEDLMRFSARDFAYQALIESQIASLQGGKGIVVYPDATHPNYGMVVDTEKLTEIRHRVFHPNSNAELRDYVRA